MPRRSSAQLPHDLDGETNPGKSPEMAKSIQPMTKSSVHPRAAAAKAHRTSAGVHEQELRCRPWLAHANWTCRRPRAGAPTSPRVRDGALPSRAEQGERNRGADAPPHAAVVPRATRPPCLPELHLRLPASLELQLELSLGAFTPLEKREIVQREGAAMRRRNRGGGSAAHARGIEEVRATAWTECGRRLEIESRSKKKKKKVYEQGRPGNFRGMCQMYCTKD